MRVTGDHIYIPDPYLGSRLKSGASCFIERKISKEHVYTNDRGWRVEGSNLQAEPAECALIGCSWPMGVGVEYEDSFAAQLQDIVNINIANLGVGSYSLLQAYRILKQEIDFIQPKVIILTYGHWLVERCFKLNAMGNVILRPIYREQMKDGVLCLEEPKTASPALLEAYTDIQRKKGEGRPASAIQEKILEIALKLQTRKLSRLIRKNSRYIVPANANYMEKRRQVLQMIMQDIIDLAAAKNCRLCLFHLYKYAHASEADIQRDQDDEAFLGEFTKTYPHVDYISPQIMKNKIEGLAGKEGQDAVSLLHWPDNNHPNPQGHRLIAETLAENLKL